MSKLISRIFTKFKNFLIFIKSIDPNVFINIVKSQGVTECFYQEPIE